MTDWIDHNTEEPARWVLDDNPGPARPLSPDASEALVQNALDAHFGPAKQRGWPMWQVAAALALVAVGVTGASAALRVWGPSQEPAAVTAPSPRPSVAQPTHTPPPVRAEPEALPEVEPAVESAPSEKPKVGAQDLLNRANALRGQREFAQAYQVYGRAIGLSPNSQTAYVARVAAAALALEHLNQPARALKGYRAALEQDPHGVLAEEAGFGVAESLRRLGRTAQEREALEAFLKAHPSSGFRARAEQRLAELKPGVSD